MAKFQRGKSGNPAGKPPGVKHAATRVREGLLKSVDVSKLVKKLTDQAMAGDTQAAGLLLARLVPALKPTFQTVRLELPDGGLVLQAESIVRHVADGSLAPDVASDLLSGLVAVARLKETSEFAERLAALETQMLQRGTHK